MIRRSLQRLLIPQSSVILRNLSGTRVNFFNRVQFQYYRPRSVSSWAFINGIRRVEVPWFLTDRSFLQIATTGWFGNLKSIAGRVRSQALESYCLWHGPLWKSLNGKLWLAERWLLITGLLRNSRNWMPNLTGGIMRPEKMLCVAVVTSLNTVGNHIPKMTLLLLAQLLTKLSSAEAPSRDSYIPWSRSFVDPTTPVSTLIALFNHCWNELCIWFRLMSLLFHFFPLLALYPLTFIDNNLWKYWTQYLRHILETCGPAFIKWGQWASTRRDLFPPEVAKELKKLQKEAPAHSGDTSRQVIQSSFGLPVDSLFDQFDDQPIASGSIGQIHRAHLSETGSIMSGVPLGMEVAVKVRHPGVDVAFSRDMKLMLWIANLMDKIPVLSGFNLREVIREFAIPMSEQVDFCVEAANLQCFRHNFRRKRKTVTFPEPLFPLVTPDIIVETFHNGISVEEIMESRPNCNESELARLGSETFFDMVIKHNLLHADLHPGNILVQYMKPQTAFERLKSALDGSSPVWSGQDDGEGVVPHIILLDAGMATQLTETERFHMLGLFRALAEMDGAAAAEHTLQFAGKYQSCRNPDDFRKAVIDHFDRISTNQWSQSGFDNGSDALGRVIDIVREHRVKLPGQICSCLFSVFILQGWSSKLDPEHSIMDQIKTLVQNFDGRLENRIQKKATRVLRKELAHL
eukprot:g544.t1